MVEYARTMWTKIRDGFESSRAPSTSRTTSSTPAPPYASRTYTFNGDLIVELDRQDQITHVTTSTASAHRPLFTVGVGVFDVLMLIIMYMFERGTTLSSNTWIKMGGKYAPCMRALSSKAERVARSGGLKSQCTPFLFPYQIYRFFTPMFLHGGFKHLLNNLVYQVLAGSLLERKYGTKTFAISYILFGFSGNVMSVLVRPRTGTFSLLAREIQLRLSLSLSLFSIGWSLGCCLRSAVLLHHRQYPADFHNQKLAR